MDEKEIGRVWAEYFTKSGDNRDALQICGMICRLIRAETRVVFVIGRTGRLQHLLESCGIAKAQFDAIEKRLSKD
jgi:hypothetical protein